MAKLYPEDLRKRVVKARLSGESVEAVAARFGVGRDNVYRWVALHKARGTIMPLNVSLTPHFEQFIHDAVSSGRYQSASEVVCSALRLLEEQERERQAKLEALRQDIQKGLDSGRATPMNAEDWDELKRRALAQAGEPKEP
jgi:antitoxin ParD1/3/4